MPRCSNLAGWPMHVGLETLGVSWQVGGSCGCSLCVNYPPTPVTGGAHGDQTSRHGKLRDCLGNTLKGPVLNCVLAGLVSVPTHRNLQPTHAQSTTCASWAPQLMMQTNNTWQHQSADMSMAPDAAHHTGVHSATSSNTPIPTTDMNGIGRSAKLHGADIGGWLR